MTTRRITAKKALLAARSFISHTSRYLPAKEKGDLRRAYDVIDKALAARRSNPFPKGKVPPHLRRYLFKKGHR